MILALLAALAAVSHFLQGFADRLRPLRDARRLALDFVRRHVEYRHILQCRNRMGAPLQIEMLRNDG